MSATKQAMTTGDLAEHVRREVARAEASVVAARADLATKAATGSVDDIAHSAVRVAEAVGRSTAWAQVGDLVNFGIRNDSTMAATVSALSGWVMAKATEGANDRWSGRTNDLTRARHDGVLEAVRRIADELEDVAA